MHVGEKKSFKPTFVMTHSDKRRSTTLTRERDGNTFQGVSIEEYNKTCLENNAKAHGPTCEGSTCRNTGIFNQLGLI